MTQAPTAMSPLELRVMQEFHQRYRELGFPDVAAIEVTNRRNTGGGRYVTVRVNASYPRLPDSLEFGHAIEMEGLPYGLSAVLWLQDGRIEQLEFVTNGLVAWDGSETAWKIV